MDYLIISFSHQQLAIKDREKITFTSDGDKKNFITIVLSHYCIEEMILLCTCNRTEVIIYTKDTQQSWLFVLHTLSFFTQISIEELKKMCNLLKGVKAVEHIFKVASSLESMVVGETQITGQLKEAYRFAFAHEFCAKGLSKLIHYAFKCAAKIRNETNLSKDSVSIASIAIQYLKEQFSAILKTPKVLVIGVGEMSRLCIVYALAQQWQVTLINRRIINTTPLSQEFGDLITIGEFKDLKAALKTHQIVFSATGSKTPIITADMITSAPFERVFVDMALPQDIDSEHISKMDYDRAVHIINMDILGNIVQQNKDSRRYEMLEAKEVVRLSVEEFLHLQRYLDVVPVIKNLRQQAQKIAQDEIVYATQRGYIDPSNSDHIAKLIDRCFNKFLHHPTVMLKKVGNQYSYHPVGDIFAHLFDEQNQITLKEDIYENH